MGVQGSRFKGRAGGSGNGRCSAEGGSATPLPAEAAGSPLFFNRQI